MAGSGDVKEKDKLFDHLARQLDVDKAGKSSFPSITELMGRPEEIFRAKDTLTKHKQDVPYGNVYSKAYDELQQDPQAPTDPDDKYLAIRDIAEDMAARAYSADVIKPKDYEDYIRKLADREGVGHTGLDVVINPSNPIEGTAGVYSPENNQLVINTPGDIGTAMHEMAHAKMTHEGNPRSKPESTSNIYAPYLLKKLMQSPGEYSKYANGIFTQAPSWLQLSDEDKRAVIDDAMKSKDAYGMAQTMSKGHYGNRDYVNYPIDKSVEDMSKELTKQGFEPEIPEESPKFEKLRSIMGTMRNLNK